jgi:Tol biopolymer transport system component
VNGSARSTGFNSNTLLTVMLTQTDLTAAGTLQLQVFNPPPGGGTSNVLPFSIIPSTTGTGLPELVDIADDGSQANQGIGNLTNSGPAIGMGGRFIAFASISTNLIAGDNDPVHFQDIYARDTCLGMTTGCTPQTLAVNLATNGVEANAPSFEPSMSGGGRFIAFTSTATNLVSGATSGAREIYLRDACLGALNCTPQTTLVSLASDGMSAANGDSLQPSVSADGRYVAFTSVATNIIAGISGQQIYLRDTCAGVASGCTAKTILVSTPDGTTAANGSSSQPVAANNGLFVAFSSTATNLVSGVNSGIQQIYLRGTCITAASGCATSTKLVSAADAGGTTPAATAAQQPILSTDGRFVIFASTAGNLGFTTGGFQQIFLRDMCTGVASGCTPSTMLVSSPDGTTAGNADSSSPQSSNNGQFVAFASNANNLVASDTNALQDVFVRNTCAGATGSCTAKTVLASVNSSGQQGNGASLSPAISGDGHFVTFISFANNLVPRDVNGVEDIFRRNHFLTHSAPDVSLGTALVSNGNEFLRAGRTTTRAGQDCSRTQ